MEKLMMTWIFSSLLTAYMSVLFMVSIVNIKISKKQWIILILSLSLCHTIFRNIIPQLFLLAFLKNCSALEMFLLKSGDTLNCTAQILIFFGILSII